MALDYQRVLDASPDAVVAADGSGSIVYANRRAEALLGWPVEELIGRPLTTIIPARLHNVHNAGFERYRATRIPKLIGHATRVPALHRDGTEVDIELSLSAFCADNDELFIASLRDLSERVELDRQVATSRYLRAATRAAVRLTSRLDLDQVVRTVVDTLVADFGAALARVWLHDSETNTLRLRASAGLSLDTPESPRAHIDVASSPYKVGEVARTGKPFFQNGLLGDPQFEQEWVERESLASVAILPLQIGGELRGVLAFFSRQEIREEVAEVLTTFATMVATALNDVHLVLREQAARAEAEAQAGLLWNQREELEVANEELQTQQEELQAANQRLQSQQEQLQQLYQDLHEEQRRTEFLAEASRVLASSLEYETTLERVAQLVVPHLADWCAVHILQEDGSIRPLAVAHVDPQKVEWARDLQQRYPPDPNAPSGVANVLRTGQTEIYSEIPDTLLVETAYDAEHLRSLRAVGLKSAMIVPLIARKRILGAISFVTAETDRRYDPDDVPLIEDLARRAATAIDNAQLYRDVQEESARRRQAERQAHEERQTIETIHRISTMVLAELDLEKLVQRVTDEATALTGAQFGALFYNAIDSRGEAYTLYTLSGVPREAFSQFPMPRNTKLFGPTFRGETVIRLDDVTQDPRYGKNAPYFGMPKGHLPVRSYLAVPVVSRSGEVFGGLFFGHPEPGVFTERHEQTLVGVAAQTAVAIDNARLFYQAQEEIAQRRQAQEALAERARLASLGADIGLALTETDYLQQSLQRCTEAVVQHLDAAFARIWTLDPGENVLKLQASAGIYTHINGSHSRVPIGQYKIGQIAQERQPHLTNAVVGDPRVHDQEWAQREGMVAFAGYPLVVEDRLVGIMAMFARKPLSEAALQAMGSVASAIALGIERSRAGEALRQSEEWFRTTLASIGDAVIVTDAEGRVSFLNAVAQSLTGWKQEDGAGEPLATVFHIVNKESGQPAENPVTQVLQKGTVVGLGNHTILLGKDGTARPIDDSAAPIRDREGNIVGVVLVFRDIGERKKAEEALREADRRKDEFLAILAHELRNPLGAISNALHVLRMSSTEQPAGRRALEVLERQVRHQSRIVDDLLDVSRITRGKIQLRKDRVDLGRIIRETTEDHRAALEEAGLSLHLGIEEEPVWVVGDPTRLSQVLGNLLQNAIKFTDTGGQVMVRMAMDKETRLAEVEVQDTGIGIDPEMLPRLFDPFAQADASLHRGAGGLGLGLALVKGLVELHGGTVSAHTEGIGRGSKFVFRLPLERATAKIGSTPSPGNGSAESRRLRVLIVEDNRDAAQSLRDLLELLCYSVEVAYSGPAAIELAQQTRHDVVLCDLGLPEMDGYAVAAALRRSPETASALLIAVSGYGQEQDQQRSRRAGFDLHLTKPVDLDKLDRFLANAAESR